MRNIQVSSDAVENLMFRVAQDGLDENENMGFYDPRNESGWIIMLVGSDAVTMQVTKLIGGPLDNADHDVPRGMQSLLTAVQFDSLTYHDRVIARFWGACLVVVHPGATTFEVEWHVDGKRAAKALQMILRGRNSERQPFKLRWCAETHRLIEEAA